MNALQNLPVAHIANSSLKLFKNLIVVQLRSLSEAIFPTYRLALPRNSLLPPAKPTNDVSLGSASFYDQQELVDDSRWHRCLRRCNSRGTSLTQFRGPVASANANNESVSFLRKIFDYVTGPNDKKKCIIVIGGKPCPICYPRPKADLDSAIASNLEDSKSSSNLADQVVRFMPPKENKNSSNKQQLTAKPSKNTIPPGNKKSRISLRNALTKLKSTLPKQHKSLEAMGLNVKLGEIKNPSSLPKHTVPLSKVLLKNPPIRLCPKSKSCSSLGLNVKLDWSKKPQNVSSPPIKQKSNLPVALRRSRIIKNTGKEHKNAACNNRRRSLDAFGNPRASMQDNLTKADTSKTCLAPKKKDPCESVGLNIKIDMNNELSEGPKTSSKQFSSNLKYLPIPAHLLEVQRCRIIKGVRPCPICYPRRR